MGNLHLEFGNRENIKSLIYSAERKFLNSKFQWNSDLQNIEWSFKNQEIDNMKDDRDIEKYVNTYFEQVEGLINYSKTETVFQRKSHVHKADADNYLSQNFKNDIVSTSQTGVFWIGGATAEIYFLLDQVLVQFAKGLQAELFVGPSIISKANLEKCGYIPRDTHQLSFLEYPKDANNLPCADHEACLSPAACLTTYPALAGTEINKNTAMQTISSVFRREGGQFSSKIPLQRVWEYQVRELIFFGDQNYHNFIREQYFNFLKKLSETLDLNCEICSASDVFIHSESASMSVFQLLAKSKYEFNLILSDDERIALSSFNSHGKKFVQSFDIRGPTVDFQSFCIGFGLQRWAQAIALSFTDIDEAVTRLRGML